MVNPSGARGSDHLADGFWRNRRVFLTGHTGFKGAWLAAWLRHLGASVTGYSLEPPTSPSLFEALDMGRDVAGDIADVRDGAALAAAMARAEPEVVLHLAAEAVVRTAYAEPVRTFDVNVMGTVHVLEGARRLPSVRVVVICTSDKSYENDEAGRPLVESDRLGGRDPYSASKACAELVTTAYRASFFSGGAAPSVVSVRAGNVFGGGDWGRDRLLPDAARAFSRCEPVVVRNPSAQRPWQYVLDPLAGYLAAARAAVEGGHAFSTAWNFGPHHSHAWTVSHLVEAFAAEWGGGASVQVMPEEEAPHEAHLLQLDSSRARTELGWAPRVGVAEALRRSAGLYKAFYAGDRAAIRRQMAEEFDAYPTAPAVGPA